MYSIIKTKCKKEKEPHRWYDEKSEYQW